MRFVILASVCGVLAACGAAMLVAQGGRGFQVKGEGACISRIANGITGDTLEATGEEVRAGVFVRGSGVPVADAVELRVSAVGDGSVRLEPVVAKMPETAREVSVVIGPFAFDQVALLSTAFDGCAIDRSVPVGEHELAHGLPIALLHGKRGGVCIRPTELDDPGTMRAIVTEQGVGLRLSYPVLRLRSGEIVERPAKAWRMAAYEGDWHNGADIVAKSLEGELKLTTFESREPAWMRDITGVIAVIAVSADTVEAELPKLAERLDPAKTIVYVSNWRTHQFDEGYPDYTASEEGARILACARGLGFHVMPHCNTFGVGVDHPRFEEFRPYYQLLPNGDDMYLWEGKFAMINPAFPEARRFVIDAMAQAVGAYGCDGLYVDFPGNIEQPLTAPDGPTVREGAARFMEELAAALPGVALGCEWQYSAVMQKPSFFWPNWMIAGTGIGRTHPLGPYLQGRYRRILPRTFGAITDDSAYGNLLSLERAAEIGALPGITLGPGYEPDHPVLQTLLAGMRQGFRSNADGRLDLPGLVYGRREAWAPKGLRDWVAQRGEQAFGLDPNAVYVMNEAGPEEGRFTLTRCEAEVRVSGGVDEARGLVRLTPIGEEEREAHIELTDGSRVEAVIVQDAQGARVLEPDRREHEVRLPAAVVHAYAVTPLPESGLLREAPYRVNLSFGGVITRRANPPHHMGGVNQVEIEGRTLGEIECHPPFEGQTQLEWLVQLPANAKRLEATAKSRQGARGERRFEVWLNGLPAWGERMGEDLAQERRLPASVDLTAYADKPTLITLVVDALGSHGCDWATWVEPRVVAQ